MPGCLRLRRVSEGKRTLVGLLSDRQLAGVPWWAPIVSDVEGPTDFDRVGICFETEISSGALDSCMALGVTIPETILVRADDVIE